MTAPRCLRARSSPRRWATTATTSSSTTTIRTPRPSCWPADAGDCSIVALTDGTYFINRWFATVESIPKTIVPIGYVGVIVSYCGRTGQDVSGQAFPPWRAGGRGRTRRAGEAAGTRQVRLQHLRRQYRHGADHQLRARTGSPAGPRRTGMMRACGRSTWSPRTRTSRPCRCRLSCTSTTRRPRASSSASATSRS